MKCANCPFKNCNTRKDCFGIADKYREIYKTKYFKEMTVAAEVAREAHKKLNRLQEVILYAKKMGYKKLGIAFCINFKEEAAIVSKALESEGFKVYSVCCKTGGISKEELNIITKIPGEKEICCNPNAQADILNEKSTELNIIIGLCVGHDIIFQNHSKAPTTVLVVKDRTNKSNFLIPKTN